MPCPLCGDICRCSTAEFSAAYSAVPQAAPETPPGDAPNPPALTWPLSAEDSAPHHRSESVPDDSPAWRQEVADRLSRYQARHKPRPPRYPSLRLRFEEENHPSGSHPPDNHPIDDRPIHDHPVEERPIENRPIDHHRAEDHSARAARDLLVEPSAFPHRLVTVSNQALALDGFADSVELPARTPVFPSVGEPPHPPNPAFAPTTVPTPAPTTAKIIEFPRSWTPPPSPLDELAEPVTDRPRILEAPEVVPPPPALGGITIEPAQQPEMEKRPGIDIPLLSAPLARRIFSAAVDGVIVAAACTLFAFVFWKLTAIRPPQFQMMALAAGLSCLFWAAYQYLLVVYSGATPGLRLARLELARFDGSPASRRLRRWRVLASFLSAASLGMGYAWVFLDEDSLCWHDRITHTYLAPKG
jgi:uncharacterized RDD family membrane protein YckC